MRSVILTAIAVLLASCFQSVSASPIPGPIASDASGIYVGSDRVCRIVLSKYQSLWVQSDIRCMHFAGGESYSLATIYTGGGCPSGHAQSLTPYAPNEYLLLQWFSAQDGTLGIVRGTNQTAVTNGIGTAETWFRVGRSPPLVPYYCGARFSDYRKP